MDTTFATLGGEQICKLGTGDDQSNQARSFNIWAKFAFYTSCKRLNVTIDKESALKADKFEWQTKKLAPSYAKSEFCILKIQKFSKRSNNAIYTIFQI